MTIPRLLSILIRIPLTPFVALAILIAVPELFTRDTFRAWFGGR